jgi:hypothetical protein
MIAVVLIKFTIVPLPMSAAQKFGEAVYFFNRMRETACNLRSFPYNLSAFLSALRSITFYLQEQFSKDPAFEVWYAGKQHELRNDPLLKRLKDTRDEALHARPVQLAVFAGPQLPEEGLAMESGGSLSLTDDAEGNVVTTYQTGPEQPEVSVPPVVIWKFDDPEELDVVAACGQGLTKLRALLDEWHQLRTRQSTTT